MADMEIIKFEAAVEKLGASWVVDVAKILKREHDAIEQRTNLLCRQIASLPFPKTADPEEIQKLPNRINEIFQEENKQLTDMVTADFPFVVDKDMTKLNVPLPLMLGWIGDLDL